MSQKQQGASRTWSAFDRTATGMSEPSLFICNSAEDCLVQGREASAARQWDQALQFIQKGLELSPDHLSLQLEQAINLRLAERLTEAAPHIENLLAKHPTDFAVVIEAGRLSRQQLHFENALKHFQHAHELRPNNQWLPVGIAHALRELNRFKEAEAALQAVLNVTPEYFDALLEMGHLANRQKEHAVAVHYYQRALTANPLRETLAVSIASHLRELGQLDEARTFLSTFLAKHPTHFAALLDSGRIARQQARYSDAISFFQRALDVRPDNEWLPCGIAACLHESGRCEEASSILTELLNSKPDHIDAWIEWANLSRRREQHEIALNALYQAKKLGSTNEWLPLKIVGCLRELRRFEEASIILEDLLNDEPNHLNALIELGQLARKQSRYTEAIEHFKKALEISPSHQWLPCGIAACLRHLGRLDECQKMLDGLLFSNPEHFDALLESGHLANRQRRGNEALRFFQRAKALRPSTPSLSLNIANVLRELGRFEEANQILTQALQANPDYFEALAESGQLAHRERKFEKALTFFQRAKALRPDHIGMRAAVAQELRELGRIDESIACIGELPEPYDPSIAPLLHQRAQIAIFQDDSEQAQHFYEASILTDPHYSQAYISLVGELQRLGLFDEARSVIERACKTLADPSPFHIRSVSLAYQCGEYERVENEAAPLLAKHPKSNELWMTLIRAHIRTGEYKKAKDALDEMPSQLLQDRLNILEGKAQLAWAQHEMEAAINHAKEWLKLSLDPSSALRFLAMMHLCNGDTASSKKYLEALKKIHAAHGSESIRKHAGKGLLNSMLREFRVNPFADRAITAALQLPLHERLMALGQVLVDEPGSIAAAMTMLITLRRLGLIGGPPINQGTTPSRIPRHIIQFWDSDPPPDILELMQTWKTQCTGFTHEIFNEHTAESFIRNEGQTDVLMAFKAATQPAMKADLFRLSYLYACGGIYADADDKCRHSLEPWLTNGLDLLLLQEDLGSIGNNFLAVAPKHPLILVALNTVTQNILQNQGGGAWWSSGPAIMTTTFCMTHIDELSQARIPDGVHVIDYNHIAKRISMHVPRAYKRSDKHWMSPKSQTLREFAHTRSVQIRQTETGWSVEVTPEHHQLIEPMSEY